MVNGVYSFQGSGFDMRSSPPLPTSVAGSFETNGEGGIVAWSDWLTLAGVDGPVKRVLPNDLVAAAAVLGNEVTYTVNPDCTMSIDALIQGPAGPLPLRLPGGLADGGSRLMLQLGSPVFIGAWTAIRVAEKPNKKLDDLDSLLKRMAVRLSVVP